MIRFLICSFTLVLLYPTAIDLYLVGLPQIAADLSASEAQLHTAFSIYLAGMVAAMLLAGRLSDSVGRKPVAIVSAMFFIFASWYAAEAGQINGFLAARFAQGLGAGGCYVVAFAILRDTLDDKKRAKVLSMINGITCVMPVLAPVIGHLIMLRFPWQSLFNLMASIGAVVALLSIAVLKESRPVKESRNNSDLLSNTDSKESFLNCFFISRLLITTLGCTIILTYVNVSPMLIMGDLGMDRGGYSKVMSLTALVSMIAAFSSPFALSVFSQRALMIFSQLLFVFSAFAIWLVQVLSLDTSLLFIAFGLLCAGFSIGFGSAMSQALSPFSQRAGMASSLLGVCQLCVSAFYIWLMGLLGLSAINILLASLLLGSIASLALILSNPEPAQRTEYEKVPCTS